MKRAKRRSRKSPAIALAPSARRRLLCQLSTSLPTPSCPIYKSQLIRFPSPRPLKNPKKLLLMHLPHLKRKNEPKKLLGWTKAKNSQFLKRQPQFKLKMPKLSKRLTKIRLRPLRKRRGAQRKLQNQKWRSTLMPQFSRPQLSPLVRVPPRNQRRNCPLKSHPRLSRHQKRQRTFHCLNQCRSPCQWRSRLLILEDIRTAI